MSSPLGINLIGDITPLIGRIFDGVADLNGGELEIEIDPDSPLLVSHDRFKDVALPAEVLYSEWRSLQTPEPNPFPCANDKVLYMDTETHNAGKQWSMSPREFFRLGQYAWGIGGDVHLTTDYDEMMDLIASAEGVVAHNGHNFDWSTLYGQGSMTPLFMARDRKLLDTMVWANLAFPAPESYTDRAGHTYRGVSKPEQIKRWLSLDNLAFQFGIEGKYGDLKELAKKHNPEGTKVADLDYGLIPVDDPEFVGYARQDIVALQGITRKLCLVSPMTDYDWREQLCAGLNAQITRNGFMVDTDLAQGRVNQLAKRREEIMNRLVAEYDFPTEGKSPWASNAGKDAIVRIFADYGITPETHIWPRTPKGALKLGGDELKKLAEGTEAEEIANALAEIKGQRSLAQLTLDNTQPDSKVHPDIDDLQRSGRSSIVRPGLTVWNARGENANEKSYYVAEPGCKLVSFDLSNADARAVAAYSQDEAYRENFLPGADNHMNVARMVYGDQPDFVNDKSHPDGAKYRQLAKACIAEGSLVLTDAGLVPIEKVTVADKVWDGVEWVTHQGTVFKGLRKVMTYDGLTATRDHKIYTTNGMEIPLGCAASLGLRIEKSGAKGRPIRTGRDYVEYVPRPKTRWASPDKVCPSEMPKLRKKWVDRLGQLKARAHQRLSPMHGFGEETRDTRLVESTAHGDEATVSKSQQPGVQKLWGQGDYVWLEFSSGGGGVDCGERVPVGQEPPVRQDRQRQRVRTGEHQNGNPETEFSKSPEYCVCGLCSDRLAIYKGHSRPETQKWDDKGRDNRGRATDSPRERVALETSQTQTRVYDIVNAGPRHRYTVSDRLVHNCSHAWNYGGGAKTISRAAGVTQEEASNFVSQMAKAFPKVVAWRNRMATMGERDGYIENKWGRRMPVVREQSYTQSSALMGQSGTREIMKDALIKMLNHDPRLIGWVKVPVHDELIFSIPESELAWAVPKIEELMYYEWDGVEFYASHGTPANDWEKAGH